MEILPRDFYDRDTLTVARELLGCYLVREWEGKKLAVRITETEAYIGRMDKACHAYQYKRTPQTETLFSKPGVSYVYLIYGMYHCLNFITEPEGEPCGVLIRGAVPVDNKDSIAENRFGCKASQLALTRAENALPLDRPPLYVCRGPVPQEIHTGKRIGIDYAQEAIDFPWRFWFTPGTEEGEHGLF